MNMKTKTGVALLAAPTTVSKPARRELSTDPSLMPSEGACQHLQVQNLGLEASRIVRLYMSVAYAIQLVELDHSGSVWKRIQ